MRVFDSNKQAIADTQLEQCYGLTATVVIGSKTKELSYDSFFSFFSEIQSSPRFNCENLYSGQDFLASHSTGGTTVWRSTPFTCR